MSRLNRDLGIGQGVGLLTTSLLGTGIFVVPAVAASIAGQWSLLAWNILIILVLPVAFTFALLGKQFPHAGGTAHVVGQAMGSKMEKLTAFLFLAVLPVGLPAALIMATGFWSALFELSELGEWVIQLGTLSLILLLGLGGAKLSGNVQSVIAGLVILLVVLLWWAGGISLQDARLPDARLPDSSIDHVVSVAPALAVMFWCFVGIEAFTHLGEEFKNPGRDFPIALLLSVLLAGAVYWGCSVAVLKFAAYGDQAQNTTAIPSIVAELFGNTGLWLAAIIGYLACFASMNIYLQGFSRLLWSMADEGALDQIGLSGLAKLNHRKIPTRALWFVVSACAVCISFIHLTELPLDALIRYANGNFVIVYLLSMLAAVMLFSGWQKILAIISAGLCFLVLITLGRDVMYAALLIVIFLIFNNIFNYRVKEVS